MNKEAMQDYTREIENAIDALGLSGFLELAGDVCHAKAEHVRSTWEDVSLARAWTAAGAQFYRQSGLLMFRFFDGPGPKGGAS